MVAFGNGGGAGGQRMHQRGRALNDTYRVVGALHHYGHHGHHHRSSGFDVCPTHRRPDRAGSRLCRARWFQRSLGAGDWIDT